VSPVDAIWRIFEFEIAQRYPLVELLQYHLPGQQSIIFNDCDRLHRVVEEGAQGVTMLIGCSLRILKILKQDVTLM